MEREGPVALAVLGSLCWVSPCLLETALASSFVYRLWRESSMMGDYCSAAHPILLNPLCSRQVRVRRRGVPGSEGWLLASRAVGRPGQVFRFFWWRKTIEGFLIIDPCYELGRWHLNSIFSLKPLAFSFLILVEQYLQF